MDPNVVALMPPTRIDGRIAQCPRICGFGNSSRQRGSIRFVNDTAKVPVIEIGAGICHTYFDEFGDAKKGADIVMNGKTRRVSVCNALDCLIVHAKRLDDLHAICAPRHKNVTLYADKRAFAALKGNILTICCNQPPKRVSVPNFWTIRWP